MSKAPEEAKKNRYNIVTGQSNTIVWQTWLNVKKVQVELPTDQSTALESAKNLNGYDQSQPIQLTPFELLLPQERGLSNTIELHDFIPKYHWGKVERIGGEFLRALEREFECRGQKYKVKIRPASIEDKDGWNAIITRQNARNSLKTRFESLSRKVEELFLMMPPA